jgi:uncharacterized membrane protein YkgB
MITQRAPKTSAQADVSYTGVTATKTELVTGMLIFAPKLNRIGVAVLRLALVVVLLWIGGLKFISYEAESIVPLMANSPLASFLYSHPAPEYRRYTNKEGEFKVANKQWHQTNRTYPVSYGLGIIIVSLAILIALYPIVPELSALGSFLLMFMSLTTLSFLITTPEAWVGALGDANHGFPFLSGLGRLIIKDSIMFGAAVVTLADASRVSLLRRQSHLAPDSHRE